MSLKVEAGSEYLFKRLYPVDRNERGFQNYKADPYRARPGFAAALSGGEIRRP